MKRRTAAEERAVNQGTPRPIPTARHDISLRPPSRPTPPPSRAGTRRAHRTTLGPARGQTERPYPVAWTPLALRDRPADPPPALRDGAPTRSIDPTRHRAPYRPQGTGLKVPYKRASMLECAVRPCAVRPCCAHALCAHALRQCTVRACDPRGACAPHSGRMRREPSRQTDGVVRRPPQSSHPISLWMPIALEAYVPRSDVSDVMANVAGALLFCIFDGHRVRQAQRQTWFHEHHASSTPRARSHERVQHCSELPACSHAR